MYGLKEDWHKVEEALSNIIPFYHLVNRLISFGKDIKLRREGIKRVIRSEGLVLDAGCGPGIMSEILLERWKGELVLLDSLKSMLKVARSRVIGEGVNALFEYLPFKDESFDLVMLGFSFRDAKDMSKTLKEIYRVLKDQGRLLIVDLGKPDNPIIRFFSILYLKYLVPIIALILVGGRGLYYSALYTTYKSYPTNRKLREILEERFKISFFLEDLFGGAIVIIGEKMSSKSPLQLP